MRDEREVASAAGPRLHCRGKHLFIEKPPGANSDETRAILEAAEREGVWVMVGLQRRYTAVTREAMRLVAAKGPVSLATTTSTNSFRKARTNSPPPCGNDLVHIVDLLRYMAGGEPVEVTAYQDKFGGEGFNHYTALVRFDNRATGVMLATAPLAGECCARSYTAWALAAT